MLRTYDYASSALFDIGDLAVDPLIKALNYKDERIRSEAAKVLGRIGNPIAIAPLISALEDESEDVRASVIIVLGKFDDSRAFDILSKILSTGSFRERRCAVEGMNNFSNPRVRDVLIAALNDDSVCARAAQFLGKMKENRAVEPLIRCLSSKDSNIRQVAAVALGEIKDPRAVEALVALARDRNSENMFTQASSSAILALGDIGDPRPVDMLIEALSDKDWYIRKTASIALGKIGDPRAVEALIRAFSDDGINVRRSVVEALGNIKDSRSIKFLIGALSDNDVRDIATKGLGNMNPEVIDHLVGCLVSADPAVRSAAVIALGNTGDPRAVEPLIKALSDNNESVRYHTVAALGKFKDPRVVGPLIKELNVFGNRSVAIEALVNVGQIAVESLIKSLSDGNVAEVLGRIGDPRAVEPMIAFLINNYKNDSSFRSLIEDAISKQIVDAISNMGQCAIEPLINTLSNEDSFVRSRAAAALGNIKDPRAVEPLIKLLSDPIYAVRASAAIALGKIGDSRAIDALLKVLEDPSGEVREKVTDALGNIKDPRAIEPLKRCLNDSDHNVRCHAAKALEEFGQLLSGSSEAEDESESIGPSSSLAPSAMPGTIPIFLMQAIMGAAEVEGDAGQGAIVETGAEESNPAEIEKTVAGLLEKIKNLSNDDPKSMDTYRDVVDSLIALGRPVVPVLIEAFNNDNENVRICAIRTLGIMKAKEAKEPLKRILSHQEMVMRVTAAMALARFGDSDAMESIARLLEDEDDTVKLTAALLLGLTGDARGVDILISSLGDAKNGMLTSIIQTLGRLKERRALEPLKRMLPEAGLELRNLLIETISNIEGTESSPKDGDGMKKPGTTKPSDKERGRIVLGSGAVNDNEREVTEILWMAGNGLVSNAEARAKLDKLIPDSGFSRKERDAAIDALLGHAASFMLLGMASKTPPAYTQPSADDINEIAGKIQGLDIEVYLPATHLIKNSTGQFRRTMEAVFGDRLTVYQDVQDLPRLIKNPGKAIVMTVELKESDVAVLEKAKQAFEGSRFMNFEAMKDMDKMSDQEYHNYIAEILGMLLV
ncbi:MAG TPA: HEAT repeat domain-containing protein, partial [Candidatus Omnitrophota bacterium]|nr:HEAT repeat domain-containing protein [Candidatus Omnitrophota bacterium]